MSNKNELLLGIFILFAVLGLSLIFFDREPSTPTRDVPTSTSDVSNVESNDIINPIDEVSSNPFEKSKNPLNEVKTNPFE